MGDFDIGMLVLTAEAQWKAARWHERLRARLFARSRIDFCHLRLAGTVVFWRDKPWLVRVRGQLPDDLADLVSRFRWTADRWPDSRHFMAGPGALEGDCDDFAATALRIEAGSLWRFWWWLLTFRAVFWSCRDPQGVNHLVLWVRGRGWIDNQAPAWAPLTIHRRRFPMPLPAVAIKLALGLMR